MRRIQHWLNFFVFFIYLSAPCPQDSGYKHVTLCWSSRSYFCKDSASFEAQLLWKIADQDINQPGQILWSVSGPHPIWLLLYIWQSQPLFSLKVSAAVALSISISLAFCYFGGEPSFYVFFTNLPFFFWCPNAFVLGSLFLANLMLAPGDWSFNWPLCKEEPRSLSPAESFPLKSRLRLWVVDTTSVLQRPPLQHVPNQPVLSHLKLFFL